MTFSQVQIVLESINNSERKIHRIFCKQINKNKPGEKLTSNN